MPLHFQRKDQQSRQKKRATKNLGGS